MQMGFTRIAQKETKKNASWGCESDIPEKVQRRPLFSPERGNQDMRRKREGGEMISNYHCRSKEEEKQKINRERKRQQKNKRWVWNVDCHGPVPALILSYINVEGGREKVQKWNKIQ